MQFLDESRAYIESFHLLDCDAVIVGVSGGADSMCLLHLLISLKKQADADLKKFPDLIAAHIHHGLRGQEADRDEEMVRNFCRKEEISFHFIRTDIASEAQKDGVGLEQAGRTARYAFFEQIAKSYSAQFASIRIATAHHREDRAETLLINLFRGAGMDGLCAMMPLQGNIIRPILFASREQIMEYIDMHKISYCEDSTNAQTRFTRNKWRHQIMPMLREVAVKEPTEALLSASDLLCNDKDFLDSYTSELFEHNQKNGLNDGMGLPCVFLSKQHKAIGSRLVRKLFTEQFHYATDLSRRQTEQLLDLAKSGGSHTKVSLANGIVARIEGEVLFFTKEGTDGPDGLHVVKFGNAAYLVLGQGCEKEIEIDIREDNFPGGMCEISSSLFSVELILVENREQLVYNNRTWYCPCASLSCAVIRTPKAEDHLTRAGQRSGKPLRRFMTDRKIPAFLREKMILVAQGHDILWIPGVAHAVGFVDEVSLDRYLGSSGPDSLFEKGSRAICKVVLKQ